MNFYGNELKRLEDISPSPDSIYCARRLLRMLDDLADEGYNELSELLEKELHGVSRLHEYLRSNGAAPFRAGGCLPDASGLSYSERETELSLAVSRAMLEADKLTDVHGIPFADRLKSFCRWIGYSSGTAYIFLLRDTLLPFVHYLGRGRAGVYPWLLGRKSFAELTGKRNADDEIRASVYRALEDGCTDCRSFFDFVLPDMRKTIAAYPRADDALRTMLASIDAKRIVVVESGCAGTFPLLLASLDPRVDMRMYTTYPYLTDIYKERVFTSRYEENRMLSQKQLFGFAGIHDGRFYVRECTDASIRQQALQEIKTMMYREGDAE